MRVMRRDRFTCTYCGKNGSEVELHVDHIIPLARGGSNHIANLTTACRQCNQSKGVGEAPPVIATNEPVQAAGLIGRFVWTLDEHREPVRQGHIIGREGPNFLVQQFSWLTGDPTSVIGIEESDLWDEAKVRIFANNQDMLDAYDEIDRRRT